MGYFVTCSKKWKLCSGHVFFVRKGNLSHFSFKLVFLKEIFRIQSHLIFELYNRSVYSFLNTFFLWKFRDLGGYRPKICLEISWRRTRITSAEAGLFCGWPIGTKPWGFLQCPKGKSPSRNEADIFVSFVFTLRETFAREVYPAAAKDEQRRSRH